MTTNATERCTTTPGMSDLNADPYPMFKRLP